MWSGIDGMTGMQKMDKIDWVLDKCTLTVTQEYYDLLVKKILFIYGTLLNLYIKDQKKP
jgi:hypothetical protein